MHAFCVLFALEETRWGAAKSNVGCVIHVDVDKRGVESRTIDCRRKDPICRRDPSTCTGCSQAQTSFLASKTSCSVDESARARTPEGHDRRMHDNKNVNASTRRQVTCRNFKWRARTLKRAWPPNAWQQGRRREGGKSRVVGGEHVRWTLRWP